MVPRIFHNESLNNAEDVRLLENTGHHLRRVLRLDSGASLILFDGLGGEWQASLKIEGKSCFAKLLTFNDVSRESKLNLHLLQGISRGDKWEWVLQKATELGVNSITPLICEKSKIKIANNKLDKKQAHWQNIVISAAEQSGRTQIPTVKPLQTFDKALAGLDKEKVLFLSPDASHSLKSLTPLSGDVTIVIGPESGFTKNETLALAQNSQHSIRLGPRVMRTETAPVAIIAIVQALWGDLG